MADSARIETTSPEPHPTPVIQYGIMVEVEDFEELENALVQIYIQVGK